jgi:hypothetical protein
MLYTSPNVLRNAKHRYNVRISCTTSRSDTLMFDSRVAEHASGHVHVLLYLTTKEECVEKAVTLFALRISKEAS